MNYVFDRNSTYVEMVLTLNSIVAVYILQISLLFYIYFKSKSVIKQLLVLFYKYVTHTKKRTNQS